MRPGRPRLKERLHGRHDLKVMLSNSDEVLVSENAVSRSVVIVTEVFQFDLSDEVDPADQGCSLQVSVGREFDVWTFTVHHGSEPSLQGAGKEIVRIENLVSRKTFSSFQQILVDGKGMQHVLLKGGGVTELRKGDAVPASCEVQFARLHLGIPISLGNFIFIQVWHDDDHNDLL